MTDAITEAPETCQEPGKDSVNYAQGRRWDGVRETSLELGLHGCVVSRQVVSVRSEKERNKGKAAGAGCVTGHVPRGPLT